MVGTNQFSMGKSLQDNGELITFLRFFFFLSFFNRTLEKLLELKQRLMLDRPENMEKAKQ